MNANEHAVDPDLMKFSQELRLTYRAAIPAAGSPDPVANVRQINITLDKPARDVPVRLYIPRGSYSHKLPILLFAHGGGFVSGDLDTHDVMLRAMANGTQTAVVSVDYRLAPEHPFPAGLEDVYGILTSLVEVADLFNGDAQTIIVCGDSAGANLAAGVALLARDRKGPEIAAQWLMYPTLSNKRNTDSWNEFGIRNFPSREVMETVQLAYLPMTEHKDLLAATPLEAEHIGLPPALMQVGEFDPLRDENIAYAAALKSAGVAAETKVYKGQHHGFMQFYKDAEHNALGETALNDGIHFVREVIVKKANWAASGFKDTL